MKIKFRSIELFGVTGSGKTFLREKIKNKLVKKGYQIFDIREIIILYMGQFLELNFYEKISMLYFSFLLKINIKTTLWNRILLKISDKYLYKEQKKYWFFKGKIDKIFGKRTKIQFNFHIWIKELIIANIIFNKLKRFNKKIIFFPDEGFVQKIFLLNYTDQKKPKNLFQKYFKEKIFCDLIINVQSPKHTIIKISKIRKKKNLGWYMNKNEIDKMFKLENKIKINKFFKFKTIKNYQKIEEQINNLIYR